MGLTSNLIGYLARKMTSLLIIWDSCSHKSHQIQNVMYLVVRNLKKIRNLIHYWGKFSWIVRPLRLIFIIHIKTPISPSFLDLQNNIAKKVAFLLDEAFPGSEVKYEDKKVIFKLSDEEARIDLSKAPFVRNLNRSI